ncbi:restriction endonuclease subunit S [Achromobacter sp. AGC78]
MKPYASYKPSGVPWLGDVPSDWTVEKLKFFAKFAGGGTPSKDEPIYWGGEIPWVSPKDMKRPLIRETEDYITSEGLGNSPCALIPPSSVLTVVRSGILQHTIPVAINTVPVTLNQDMKALIPDDRMDSRYLAYQIEGCQKELREEWVKQGATVESIEHQRMVDSRLAVPSPDEQQAIADYLDAEIARIDTLIHEKDELIGLLREWRQSVIVEAVTKGLDKSAAMKPSGVSWLGNLPANWDEAQIRHVTSRVTDGAHVSPDTSSPDMPFVSTVDIKNEKIDFDNCLGTTSASYEILKRTGCKPFKGDVLFSKDGTIGRTCVVDYEREFVVASSLVIISPEIDFIESRYLSYWLNNSLLKQHYELLLAGAALRRISIEKVSRLPVFLPTTSEQQAIADYLDTETAKIDDLIAHTHDEIALLKELRAATIADGVLGRIDVRGSAKTIAACA